MSTPRSRNIVSERPDPPMTLSEDLDARAANRWRGCVFAVVASLLLWSAIGGTVWLITALLPG